MRFLNKDQQAQSSAAVASKQLIKKGLTEKRIINFATITKASMWRKKSILLIDENSDELRLFVAALNELGIAYNCTYARNAEQGLKILAGIIPDFIFLDMGVSAGVECLAQIRRMSKLRDVPVIIYAKHVSDETRKNALKMGSVVFVKKTSNLKALAETLQMILTPTQKEIQLLYS